MAIGQPRCGHGWFGCTNPVHRLPLADDEVTERDGIPLTTITRTTFDLAAVLPRHQVERVLNDAHGIPRPRTNFHLAVAGRLIECDCVLLEHRLIVELDGYAAHRTGRAFERDRLNARALTVAGWRVIRVTPRQLTDALAADLHALVSPASWRPG